MYFDLPAAPRSSRWHVSLRAVNPFNKFITLVALEADHIEERIAGVGIMGEWQCRPSERDVKKVDGYQIAPPVLAVDIDLEIERLCLARHLAQGSSAAAYVIGAICFPSFCAPFDQGRHKTDAKTLRAQILFVFAISDFNQMKAMQLAGAPLLRQFGRRPGNAERAGNVVGAAQGHDG